VGNSVALQAVGSGGDAESSLHIPDNDNPSYQNAEIRATNVS
jgi:hypothetical protein